LFGLTPQGGVFEFARNNGKYDNFRGFTGDFTNSEFAGACFSPDGRWLFVNVYTPGHGGDHRAVAAGPVVTRQPIPDRLSRNASDLTHCGEQVNLLGRNKSTYLAVGMAPAGRTQVHGG